MVLLKRNFLFLFLFCILYNQLFAQSKESESVVKYRRSALHVILIKPEDFLKKEVVINAYKHAPFPDKYDNHSIAISEFDPANYTITDEEKKVAGVKKQFFGNLGASMLSDVTQTSIENVELEYPLRINKFIEEQKLANKLVAKWFNRQSDGSFDMSLIADRGAYNATEMEAKIASGSVRGIASLADAGEELISNTFVVFTKLTFVSNEPVAAIARDAARAKAADLAEGLVKKLALNAIDVAYEKAKEGYSVWTTSFLYKLNWNNDLAFDFYSKYWIDTGKIDANKKNAFDHSSDFSLSYIGSAKSSALVTFSFKTARTEEQQIELATIRNIDNVFAKLQKEYDVFKTKTPLYSGYPITAKIGLKEGLKPGDRFEVLEQVMDPKTGLTTYVRKGIIRAEKNEIWDNRYKAEEYDRVKNIDKNLTTFSGGKNYAAGMLIRQIK